MNNPDVSKRKKYATWVAACCLGSVFLTGCASAPKAPNQALQAAEMAIQSAEQARVADYASPELGEARSNLTAARSAVVEKDMVRAARLAEKSRADAELAIAKAQAAKAQQVNDELSKNVNTLQQELQRNTGGAL